MLGHFWKLTCWKSARRCGAKHISKSKCTKHTKLGALLEVDTLKKVHTVVARSTFPSQNVQNTTCSEHFWKLTCRKSARRCGAKHISKSKCTKHTMLGALLEVDMLKKCTPLWREAHFQVKSVKNWRDRSTLERSDVILGGRRKGFCTLSKVSKTWRFCSSVSKALAGVGLLKRICKEAFCVAVAVQETCSSEMFGGQGADFLRSVAFWSIRSSGRFAKVILRDRCSTSYDLALFRGRRNTLDRWSGNIAKRIGTRSSALHSSFHFSMKSRRIAAFLMLSTSKIEEVSQNFFVFWYCQKIEEVLENCYLSSSKIEEISQNSFVFKLADRQLDK